jgi:hypothetical protein
MNHDLAKRAVITVGTGRCFIVEGPREADLPDRFVVTPRIVCLPFCPVRPFPLSTINERTYRSKWSRVLRYARKAKPAGQRLIDFIKSKGGLNECARKFARIAS